MTKSATFHFRPLYILSLLPLGYALGFLLQIFPAPTVDSNTLAIAALGSLVLFTLSVYYAGSISKANWMSYIHLASAMAWLTSGAGIAVCVVIVGSVIGTFVQRSTDKNNVATNDTAFVDDLLGRIIISGNAVLVEYFLFTMLLGLSIPFTGLTFQSLFGLLITLGAGKAVSMLLGSLLIGQSIITVGQEKLQQQDYLIELLFIFVTGIVAISLYEINTIAFVLIVLFFCGQLAVYYRSRLSSRYTSNRLKELSTLNSVAQNISANIELDEALKNTYIEINRLVNATTIFIALYDDSSERLQYQLVMTDGNIVEWNGRRLSQGMTDYVIRNKTTLYIRKSETQRLRDLGINADHVESSGYLGLPMIVGDKIIGVLGIVNRDNPDVLGETNINVLETITKQASLALRNATLYDRTTKLANSLSLINRSVQDVMFNLDHQEAMRAACTTAMNVSQAQKVAIFLTELQEKPMIKLVYSIGISPEFEAMLNQPVEQHITNNGANLRTVSNIADIEDEYIHQLAEIGDFQAFAEIPLKSGNTIVGYMFVYHDRPHHYHSLEIDLLEMLTSQITVALDNSDLLQALEIYASEQAQLVHLSSISTSSLELERVITDVAQLLLPMLKVTHIQIGLYVAGRNHLNVYNPQQNGFLDIKEYPLSNYPEFQIDITNMIRYPHILFASDTALSDSVRSYMDDHASKMLTVVPMVINNEIIGLILIGDSQERVFRDNERRLIEMATTQIAAQIHNAQIHTLTEEALVQRLEQLSLIEDIGQKISRALDLDLIINNVLEAALRSTQADLASLALIADDNTMRVKVQQLKDGDIIQYEVNRPTGVGIVGQVMKSGIMRVISDNRKVPEYVAPHVDEVEYLSSLAVPLTKGDTVIGVLNVESIFVNFFTDEHAGFIKSLAGHAIISIDNANLLDERQKQINILTQLRDLALSATTTEATTQVINNIIQTSMEMLQGNGGALLTYNSDKNEIQRTTGWVRLGSNFVEDFIFIPDSLLYQVAHTDDTLFIENVEKHDRYRNYDQRAQVNYGSVAIMPIKRRSQVTELLCITFKEARKFSKQDQNTIELLTIQVSNHLENAILSEEIRTSNVRMRAILDSTRDGIILLDRYGNLQDVNISAEELLNIDLSNYIDQNFATTLMNHSYPTDDEDSFSELIKTARIIRNSPERNMIREYTLHTNGKVVYIREVSSPVWDSMNRIVGRLLSLRDVTEERSIEDFRNRLQSMIVHDLKSPLSAIISSMVLAVDILNESQDEVMIQTLTPILEVSQESSANLMELVESLLDIGKMRRKQMDINSKQTPFKELADNAYTTLMASFKHYGINMKFDIAENLPDVYVDPHLIDRVVVNLLQNALKFTPVDGTIQISAHRDSDRQDMIQVLISDTGPGIPANARDKIFGEFEQIKDNTHKQQRGSKGSGLGLTFCKLAVEEHGGRIWVADSGPLTGATFAFTLPVFPQ